MRLYILETILALMVIAAGTLSASAQSASPYVFAFGGLSFNDDFGTTLPGDAGSFQFELGDGWNIGAGVGLRSSAIGGIRFELEGFITENQIERATVKMNPGPPPPAPPVVPPVTPMDPTCNDEVCEVETTSEVIVKAAMINVLKEFPIGCVTGYLGGGIGVASFGIDSQLGDINFFDSDTAFAWQLIAGVDVPVTECVSLFSQYRLLSVGEVDLESVGVAFTRDQSFTHSVNLGARYSF